MVVREVLLTHPSKNEEEEEDAERTRSPRCYVRNRIDMYI